MFCRPRKCFLRGPASALPLADPAGAGRPRRPRPYQPLPLGRSVVWLGSAAPPPGGPQRTDPQPRSTFAVARPQRPAARQHAQSQRHSQPVRGPHPPPPAAAATARLHRARRAALPPGPGRAPWLPIGGCPPLPPTHHALIGPRASEPRRAAPRCPSPLAGGVARPRP